MTLDITPAAQRRIALLLAETPDHDFGMRIFIEGGGCGGFKYGFKFEDLVQPDDSVHEVNGLKIIVDAHSASYLSAATVDWVEGLSGSFFKIDNPAVKTTCGCGASFSMDIG